MSLTTEKAPAEENKEDEITYSDDEVAAAKPVAAAPQADGKPAESGPAATTDESKPADTKEAAAPAEEAAHPAAEEKPAVSYAIGLSSTTADEEAKKREERAKRFGIQEDDDAKKRAERAKRFGIDEKELASGLDSALPERPLKRGRGRDVAGEGGRPGKRQSVDRRGGGRRRGGGGRRDGDAPAKRSIIDDPVEKAKAEKRAARFASN